MSLAAMTLVISLAHGWDFAFGLLLIAHFARAAAEIR